MQNNLIEFNLQKKSNVDKTFRVAKIMADFDLQIENLEENFIGKIELPDEWNIGVIVGNSGTGKTTIATNIFKDKIKNDFEYKSKSVIDDMPKGHSVEDISKMFYTVGFGSVPSWLKPYHVLSNGEKMRVDLARKLLEEDYVIFDEFTSVVDRTVAETMCIATNKTVKRLNKKFIAVSCHYDILEWLQPDWYFDTNEMKSFFQLSHELKSNLKSKDVILGSGKSLKNIII